MSTLAAPSMLDHHVKHMETFFFDTFISILSDMIYI